MQYQYTSKTFQSSFNIQKGKPNNDIKNFTNRYVYNCYFYVFITVSASKCKTAEEIEMEDIEQIEQVKNKLQEAKQ